jgi:hypothetical protein
MSSPERKDCRPAARDSRWPLAAAPAANSSPAAAVLAVCKARAPAALSSAMLLAMSSARSAAAPAACKARAPAAYTEQLQAACKAALSVWCKVAVPAACKQEAAEAEAARSHRSS